MRATLVFLFLVVASATSTPLQDIPKLNPNRNASPKKTEIVDGKDAANRLAKKQSEKADGGTKDWKSSLLTSISIQDNRAESKADTPRSPNESNEVRDKPSKKNRKHKAIFVNYPLLPQLPFTALPSDVDYTNNNNNNNLDTEGRDAAGKSNSYEESNIFYIRLPPSPYTYVPGLGYISQPPTYSTASLRPQLSYTKPGRPSPDPNSSSKVKGKPKGKPKPVNPFIKLPIDFVSNGKPTSVYQWQKKNKKPTDSPITNLDSLSPDFVSNGKPTSVYQWQSSGDQKPSNKKPDDLINKLDKGPYAFNGKPTSFFLLKADGTSTVHQPLRFPGYQQDNSYY